MTDCKNCLHVAVCARYSATGGMVRKCQHFAADIDDGSKWIPVTELLPKLFENVVVFDSIAGEVRIAFVTEDSWWGVRRGGKVTHWMPLPEEPKGEDND